MLWHIINQLRPSTITKAIEADMSLGGKFQALHSTTKALNKTNLIQYKRNTDAGEIYGLGVSPQLSIAKMKAFFEFLERKAFLEKSEEYKLNTSSGIAAHKFLQIARSKSIEELIERDSLLAHWHLKIPISFSQHYKSNHFQEIKNILKTDGYSLILAETHLGLSPTTVAILINIKSNGFCLGSCFGNKILSAYKATDEALVNLYYGNHGRSIDEIKSSAKNELFRSLQDHRAYWLYIKEIPEWLVSKDSHPRKMKIVHQPKFKHQTLATNPFPVVAAISEDILNLSVGLPNEFTTQILTRRYGISISLNKEDPHPIF